MGRSVSVPNGAVNVCFSHVDIVESFEWDDLRDDYRIALCEAFPSAIGVSKGGRWIGREDYVVAWNNFADFGLSEYCGVVSLWMVPRGCDGKEGIRDRWLSEAGEKFAKCVNDVFSVVLERVATFSNGEAVYREV